MEPTLQIGDALLGSKFAYGYSRWSLPYGLGPASETRLFGKLPARGDVVIFRKPGDTNTILIKRVIGLPGDRIQMVHGRLMINGQQVPLEPAGTGKVEDANGQWDANRQIHRNPARRRAPHHLQGRLGRPAGRHACL